MTLEERLSIISKKAQSNEIEKLNKEMNEKNIIENALNKIKELKPRIEALIILGNKCIEEGIDFPSSSETTKLGYGNGYNSYNFIADGFYHHVGFMDCEKVYWHQGKNKYKTIAHMGIKNGGCCGSFDFYTDGTGTFYKDRESGRIKEADLRDLKNFLKEFDSFEAAFYKWIDSLAE